MKKVFIPLIFLGIILLGGLAIDSKKAQSATNLNLCGIAGSKDKSGADPNYSYAYNAGNYRGGFCVHGSPSAIPSFPRMGEEKSWVCKDETNTNSQTCYAKRNSNIIHRCIVSSQDILTNATLCDDDNLNLQQDTNVVLSPKCTLDRKCEYTCEGIYMLSGGKCIISNPFSNEDEFKCLGNSPANANLCSGDNQNLPIDKNIVLSPQCTSDIKCEYVCKEGYELSGETCIQSEDEDNEDNNSTCGSVPSPYAELCLGDDQDFGNDQAYLFPSCTDERKCEYVCKSGYTFKEGDTPEGRSCVPNTAVEDNNPQCGTANGKIYEIKDSSFGDDTLCAKGIASPLTPAFPEEGKITKWKCSYPGNWLTNLFFLKNTASCVAAKKSASVVSGCGDAAGDYLGSATNFRSDNFCASGFKLSSSGNPVFPTTPGDSIDWVCRPNLLNTLFTDITPVICSATKLDDDISPPNLDFSVNQTTINLGQSIGLSWIASGNATSCIASGDWNGPKSYLNNIYNEDIIPISIGTKIYKLECFNDSGSSGIKTVTVVVSPKPNEIPIASILMPSGNENIKAGEAVMFSGKGTDADGTIKGYQWLNGSCNGTVIYSGTNDTIDDNKTISFPTTGKHLIYFKVQDDDGAWSACRSRTMTVRELAIGCSLNGKEIIHGGYIKAYQKEKVFGQSCQSQERFCNNGILSGSYNFLNCSENTAKVLLWNVTREGWELDSTWNHWNDGRGSAVIKMIKGYDPDIVLVQEVTANMVADLSEGLLGYYSHYARSGPSDSSNAIFSKLPITSKGVFYVNMQSGRTCPYAVINGVEAYSCHMPPPYLNDRDMAKIYLPLRLEGMTNIANQTKNKNNIILGGDFNTQKYSADLADFLGVSRDIHVYETIRQGYSSCGGGGVDYVFSSHVCNVDVNNRDVINSKLSDHPLFLISVNLNNKFTGN